LVRVLPRSTSSIWWGGDHHFNDDGDALMLEVAVPEAAGIPRAARYFRIRLDLATGKTTTVRDMDWTHALAASARMNAEQARQRDKFEGPLVAPATQSRRAWTRYAREVFLRRDPDWQTATFEGLVVHLPPDRGAISNLRSIRGMLGHSRLPGRRWVISPRHQRGASATTFVFASPASRVLADALVKEAATLPAGALTGWRVVVVSDPRDAGTLRMALTRLGADFIAVDPAEPIPQRPERIRIDG
jgi:hypothetical protein